MREWLIALGILVVVAVLLDGVRRMRNARRDSLQLALNMNRGVDLNGLDMFDGEQGIGTARIVAQRDELDDEPSLQEAADALTESGRRKVDLSQSIPILIDVNEHQPRIEPGFDSENDDDSVDDILSGTSGVVNSGVVNSSIATSSIAATDAPSQDEDDALFATRRPDQEERVSRKPFASSSSAAASARPVLDSATTPLSAGESDILGTPRVYDRPADRPPPRREPPVIKESKPVIKARQERELKMQQDEQKVPQQLPLEDMIIITVMARERSRFPGAALLEVLLASGLRYGHHNIFHYYTGEDREDESLYSVVNAVKPGTFDLNQMETFNTPGVSLFLRLPTPGRAMDAFESMLTTARSIAESLNGELRDENRSVMTAQTIEHCRQRIRDFEMQSRLRAR